MTDPIDNSVPKDEESCKLLVIAVISFGFAIITAVRLLGFYRSGMIAIAFPYTSCLLAGIGLLLGIVALRIIFSSSRWTGRGWASAGVLLSALILIVALLL